MNTLCPKLGAQQWSCTYEECVCHLRETISRKWPDDYVWLEQDGLWYGEDEINNYLYPGFADKQDAIDHMLEYAKHLTC